MAPTAQQTPLPAQVTAESSLSQPLETVEAVSAATLQPPPVYCSASAAQDPLRPVEPTAQQSPAPMQLTPSR